MEAEKKPNYQIFSIDSSEPFAIKKTIERFYAEDDAAANKHLIDNYKKTTSDARNYYWGRWSPIYVIGYDGKTHEYDDFKQSLEADEPHGLKKLVEVAKYLWDRYVISIFKRTKWWIQDFIFLVKNKFDRSAIWSLDTYLLDVIGLFIFIESDYAKAIIDIFGWPIGIP